jgi:hypothetical protein
MIHTTEKSLEPTGSGGAAPFATLYKIKLREAQEGRGAQGIEAEIPQKPRSGFEELERKAPLKNAIRATAT